MQLNKRHLLLNADEIQKELKTQVIAKKIYAFAQLSSTNDFAKRLAQAGENEGSLIISEQQTKGRGRLGRSWESPPGQGLWFSLVLRPNISIEKIGLISLFAGVSVAQAVENMTNLTPALKWPNDLLINSKKFCGVLIESEIESRTLSFLVLGIGINVNQSVLDFSDITLTHATSLQIESGAAIDRIKLLVEVLHNFERNYSDFKSENFSNILNEWKKRCPYLNKKIVIRQNHRQLKGVFENLDESGRLLLRLANGEIKKISEGETVFSERK
jgi:BirA family biotin operon repressor/biotin-[acetyl-CoA-carboxylase] ligase